MAVGCRAGSCDGLTVFCGWHVVRLAQFCVAAAPTSADVCHVVGVNGQGTLKNHACAISPGDGLWLLCGCTSSRFHAANPHRTTLLKLPIEIDGTPKAKVAGRHDAMAGEPIPNMQVV